MAVRAALTSTMFDAACGANARGFISNILSCLNLGLKGSRFRRQAFLRNAGFSTSHRCNRAETDLNSSHKTWEVSTGWSTLRRSCPPWLHSHEDSNQSEKSWAKHLGTQEPTRNPRGYGRWNLQKAESSLLGFGV